MLASVLLGILAGFLGYVVADFFLPNLVSLLIGVVVGFAAYVSLRDGR